MSLNLHVHELEFIHGAVNRRLILCFCKNRIQRRRQRCSGKMNEVAKYFSHMEALIHAVEQYCSETIPIIQFYRQLEIRWVVSLH